MMEAFLIAYSLANLSAVLLEQKRFIPILGELKCSFLDSYTAYL